MYFPMTCPRSDPIFNAVPEAARYLLIASYAHDVT
jgi:hypothetical protein